jgi:hypothetical protein
MRKVYDHARAPVKQAKTINGNKQADRAINKQNLKIIKLIGSTGKVRSSPKELWYEEDGE